MALPLSQIPPAVRPTPLPRPEKDHEREPATRREGVGRGSRVVPWTGRRAAPLPLELLFGSEVWRDGEAAGQLAGVVVCPATWQATHLVLRRETPKRREIMVPIDLLQRAADDGVWLDLTQEALDQLPPLRQSPDGVVIGRGTRLFGSHGALGRVRGLLLPPASRTVGDLIVRTGWLLGRDVRAPRAWRRELQADRVVLGADRAQLDQLPRFRPGRALAAAVQQTLRASEPLRRLDLPGIRIRAAGGVVELTGYVGYRQGRQFAEALARPVEGVTMVSNRLIADEDLVGRVALAIGKDDRCRGAFPQVAVHAGAAILEGTMPSAAARVAAVAAARRVAGVRAVSDRLVVDPTVGAERWAAMIRRKHGLLPNDRLLRQVGVPA